MKKTDLNMTRIFDAQAIKKYLVHDSPYFKIINFNISAGQIFPVHSHAVEGQLSILVLEGSGKFLGKDEFSIDAGQGEILISEISEPHGVQADTDMRILVTIAPPI